jgi:alpha-tubulin suppressor-like RCC1 family protein
MKHAFFGAPVHSSDGKWLAFSGYGEVFTTVAPVHSPDATTAVDRGPGPVFTSVSAGGLHTCALTAEGEAFCWGSNFMGQLGAEVPKGSVCKMEEVGNLPCSTIPRPVQGGLHFRAIVAGGQHTCAVTADEGRLYCWGENLFGQVGADSTGTLCTVKNETAPCAPAPVPVSVPAPVVALDAGAFHTCAADSAGTVYCWGLNDKGQVRPDSLGDTCPGNAGGPVPCYRAPVVVPMPQRLTTLGLGSGGSCGIDPNGTVWCWGDKRRLAPDSIRVEGSPRFTEVRGGYDSECAANSDGIAYCWGAYMIQMNTRWVDWAPHRAGTVGPGAQKEPIPMRLVDPGSEHMCGLSLQGAALCWGSNVDGQLGIGGGGIGRILLQSHVENSPQPVPTGKVYVSFTVGYYHACGVTTDAVTLCWGWNNSGQLGDGSTKTRSKPVAVVSAP